MPGRRWTIDTHPDRAKIIKAICAGKDSMRGIAKHYDISASNVTRYLEERLSEKAALARAHQDREEGQAVLDQLREVMGRMKKLYDACDDYLKDPENPDRYELGPRSWEVDIVYRTVEEDTGHMITRKEGLQAILDKLDQRGYQPWEVRMKQADPRRLIVETAGALTRQLELMAKIEGAIAETTINVNISEKFLAIKAVLVKATAGHPEVMERIVEELEKQEAQA